MIVPAGIGETFDVEGTAAPFEVGPALDTTTLGYLHRISAAPSACGHRVDALTHEIESTRTTV